MPSHLYLPSKFRKNQSTASQNVNIDMYEQTVRKGYSFIAIKDFSLKTQFSTHKNGKIENKLLSIAEMLGSA